MEPTDAGDRRRGAATTRPRRGLAPGSRWGRYVVEDLLGEGGMGRVYRAWDPALARRVALKTLRVDDPTTQARLLAEARAQAGIDHENVCKIYEVGEVDGEPFLALQLLDGIDLAAAAPAMSLNEKVETMATVAEAVHAAHRRGLVHRDLKPDNILVERREDGGWKPYVLDFGIARATAGDEPGLTRAGMAVGTLAYMAPEQARGERETVDRRADVYALGATLYTLLAGRPPIPPGSEAEQFAAVLDGEPVPLTRVDPSLPRDLEVIAARCLEKDPRRRYDSARALAEDLARFVDGEPILARPVSRLERMVRRLRKHPAAATAIGLALAGALAAAGWAVATQLAARRQAESAHRFGQEIERIEATMRQAALLPLHDTRPERAAVAERMEAVAAQLDGLGAVGSWTAGSAHHALGRGHLALDRPAEARRHLEDAWRLGYREPEAAFALGQALVALYREALEGLSQLRAPELRVERRREIEAELRAPALAALAAARGAAGTLGGDHPEQIAYLEGLLAFTEGRYDEAATRGREAAAADPALYEAWLLVGDAQRAVAGGHLEVGEVAAAEERLARAGEAFASAAEVARSAPRVHAADCERLVRTIEAALARDASPEVAAAASLAACDRALAAHPDFAEAHALRAQVLRLLAEYRGRFGADPTPLLAEAVSSARAAVAADPAMVDGHLTLGTALLRDAERAINVGEDPVPVLDEAIGVLERAVALNRRLAPALNDLGMAFGIRADFEQGRGGDPRPWLARAAASFRGASDLAPRLAVAWNNAGLAGQTLAEAELARGRDARPALAEAIAAFDRALAVNPASAAFLSNRALTWQTFAQAEVAAGGDPEGAFAAAAEGFAAALAIEATNTFVLNNDAACAAAEAEHRLALGVDPEPAFDRARRRLAASLAINPTDSVPWGIRGQLEAALARRAPSPAAADRHRAQAVVDLERSLALNPAYGDSWAALAAVHREAAAAHLSRREAAAAAGAARRALSAAERALAVASGEPGSLAERGAARLILARSLAASAPAQEGESAPDLAAAGRADLDRALAANPYLERDYRELQP